MNPQDHIRKVLNEETNLKNITGKLIKNVGFNVAIDVVGGFDKLCEIMEIETPMDLLNLCDDLEMVESIERPGTFLFRNKIGDNYFIYERRIKEAKVLFNQLIDQPFNFNTNDSIYFDVDKLSFAKDIKERDERWRKLLTYNLE
jgi:hypothetical protein